MSSLARSHLVGGAGDRYIFDATDTSGPATP
jgi:hypothetical protein